MVVVVLGVTFVAFALMHYAPGDPAERIALARYGTDLTQEQIDAIRVAENLDAPMVVQYATWLDHVLHLDLGNSLINGDPVAGEIAERLPATVQLAVSSLLLSLAISIPFGTWAAMREGTGTDRALTTLALLGQSVPNFWLSLILIWAIALTLGLLPSYGYGTLANLVLPTIVLGTSLAAVTMRLMRSSMIDTLHEGYMDSARAKGMDESLRVRRHAVRNALLPVLTFAGIQLGMLLGGMVVIESIFAWPGIGSLLVDAANDGDYAMMQGCVLFIAVAYAVVNLLVDISYSVVDPRVRYDARA